MKVTFWLCVCLICATIGLGHMAYALYFAGEPAGDAVLFDGGEPQTHRIDIAETDFPIRMNLEMWGNRKRVGPLFLSLVTIESAGVANCEPIEFQAGISEDGDIVNVTAGSGNATLQVGPIRNKTRASKLLNCSSAGDLVLSATVSDERDFEMENCGTWLGMGAPGSER